MLVVDMFTAREILAVSCLGYHTKTGKHREGGGWGGGRPRSLVLPFPLRSCLSNLAKKERVRTIEETKTEKTMKGMQEWILAGSA